MRVLRIFLYQRELTPFLILIGLFLYFTVRSGSNFTGLTSLSSAAGYAGPIGGIAVGQVLLLVLAEIDLSAGQIFLFCPWMEFWLHNAGLPLILAIVLALLISCMIGAVNGLITVLLNVPSFVTTLAMNFILFGAVLVGSADASASPIPLSGQSGFISSIMGNGQWAEIVWVLAVTAILAFVLTQTRFGMRITATGGNLLGAAEAGVPIKRVKVWAFVLSAFVAGLIGIVDAVKYGTLDPGNEGVSYILYAVGACVIGGTALTGGRGTIVGAFIGAILLGLLEDGLTVAGASTNVFFVYVGVVIVVAMAINVQFDRLVARSRAK
ncbi:MAG TPA: ABC transporter permease [Solirubrobacteraceae bacterium]|jgi:simple sugar transport system permease protein|nr:ABC transporter permease [Solirubrobacteraceae bacterium]